MDPQAAVWQLAHMLASTANLDRLAEAAAARGVTAVLHPHVGTMVENRTEVARVLGGSAIPLCLDTGNLLIGGTDPLDWAPAVPQRIAHAHLKDVDAGLAARVQSGELTYTEAVAQGKYRPLGAGDVDIAGIVSTLRDNGFDGWFVLEQDTILDGEPADEGPIRDVLASVTYLRGVAGNSAQVWRCGWCAGRIRIAELASWDRPASVGTGWRRCPPVIGGGRVFSPKVTVSNAFSGLTRTWSTPGGGRRVDRVLHNRANVRESTRREVEQAIGDLDKQRSQLLAGRGGGEAGIGSPDGTS